MKPLLLPQTMEKKVCGNIEDRLYACKSEKQVCSNIEDRLYACKSE
ncbi:hypothetical protein QA612_09550 [Evansella sp. AB-P1]|nr:hypothetical protein [Evansella sp. AB-P1]MDG5787743.1 hypothetical protein [Evansella sp. AB-P1]